MILFFDTETTGIPDRKRDFKDESQPKIVQLAAILANEKGDVVSSMDLIVKPDGWSIPPEVSKIHGITTEKAQMAGVPIAAAISVFNNLAINAKTIVAHNIQFDLDMVRIQYAQKGWPDRTKENGKLHYCTCENMRDHCKLPLSQRQRDAGFTEGYRQPSLSAAYEFVFKQKLQGEHNALVDVQACKDIYFWLMSQGDQQ